MNRNCAGGIVLAILISVVLVWAFESSPTLRAEWRANEAAWAATYGSVQKPAKAPPIDPFVVEWIEAKAKEKQADLGKPKGPIQRVISQVSGVKGFLREYEHGVVSASSHGTYTVTGDNYKKWKPRSGLKPYVSKK